MGNYPIITLKELFSLHGNICALIENIDIDALNAIAIANKIDLANLTEKKIYEIQESIWQKMDNMEYENNKLKKKLEKLVSIDSDFPSYKKQREKYIFNHHN